MINPFREAAEDPEIQKVRIHEEHETQRYAFEQRELTKREDLKQRDTLGYVIPRFIWAVVVTVGIVWTGINVNDSIHQHDAPKPCTDEKWSSFSSKCSSSEHVSHVEGATLICVCRANIKDDSKK